MNGYALYTRPSSPKTSRSSFAARSKSPARFPTAIKRIDLHVSVRFLRYPSGQV